MPYANFITANCITAIFQHPGMTKNEKDSQEDTKKPRKWSQVSTVMHFQQLQYSNTGCGVFKGGIQN